jgi:hypothetical protein
MIDSLTSGVNCWGAPESPELLLPGISVQGREESPVTHIVCSDLMACALRLDRRVFCWGRLWDGAGAELIFRNHLVQPLDPLSVPDSDPTALRFVDVAVAQDSEFIVAAVTTEGGVRLLNNFEVLNSAEPILKNIVPADEWNARNRTSISCGPMQCCTLDIGGEVRCFALFDSDELLVPDPASAEREPVTSIVGTYPRCAERNISSSPFIFFTCWSTVNGWSTAALQAAVVVPHVVQIAVGRAFSCMLWSTGSVWCVGTALSMPPLGNYISLSLQRNSVCAVSDDHRLVCWGGASSGSSAGLQLSSDWSVSDVFVGSYVTCVLAMQSGFSTAIDVVQSRGEKAFCFGPDYSYQLTPRDALRADSISLGFMGACVIISSSDDEQQQPVGSLRCWTKAQGTVGAAGASISDHPTDAPYTAVVVGPYSACALADVNAMMQRYNLSTRPNGNLICWGSPTSFHPFQSQLHELGVADAIYSHISISTSSLHCAVRLNDSAGVCWFFDAPGSNVLERIDPPGNTTWQSLTAGKYWVCGILSQNLWTDSDINVRCFDLRRQEPRRRFVIKEVWGIHWQFTKISCYESYCVMVDDTQYGVVGCIAAGQSTIHPACAELSAAWEEDTFIVTDVALGNEHLCIVWGVDSQTRCFGRNFLGETIFPPTKSMTIAVVASAQATCKLSIHGQAECVGRMGNPPIFYVPPTPPLGMWAGGRDQGNSSAFSNCLNG